MVFERFCFCILIMKILFLFTLDVFETILFTTGSVLYASCRHYNVLLLLFCFYWPILNVVRSYREDIKCQ